MYDRLELQDPDDVECQDDALFAQILSSNDHLHDAGSENEFSLFLRMLEWMEIEAAITKSYNRLSSAASVGPTNGNQVFQDEELQTVNRVLQEVDSIVQSAMTNFFDQLSFTLGVLNTILVACTFSAYQEHFWLLYLIEGLFLLPRNFYVRLKAKPLNRG